MELGIFNEVYLTRTSGADRVSTPIFEAVQSSLGQVDSTQPSNVDRAAPARLVVDPTAQGFAPRTKHRRLRPSPRPRILGSRAQPDVRTNLPVTAVAQRPAAAHDNPQDGAQSDCQSCGTPIIYQNSRAAWVHTITRFEPSRVGDAVVVTSGAHLAMPQESES